MSPRFSLYFKTLFISLFLSLYGCGGGDDEGGDEGGGEEATSSEESMSVEEELYLSRQKARSLLEGENKMGGIEIKGFYVGMTAEQFKKVAEGHLAKFPNANYKKYPVNYASGVDEIHLWAGYPDADYDDSSRNYVMRGKSVAGEIIEIEIMNWLVKDLVGTEISLKNDTFVQNFMNGYGIPTMEPMIGSNQQHYGWKYENHLDGFHISLIENPYLPGLTLKKIASAAGATFD